MDFLALKNSLNCFLLAFKRVWENPANTFRYYSLHTKIFLLKTTTRFTLRNYCTKGSNHIFFYTQDFLSMYFAICSWMNIFYLPLWIIFCDPCMDNLDLFWILYISQMCLNMLWLIWILHYQITFTCMARRGDRNSA